MENDLFTRRHFLKTAGPAFTGSAFALPYAVSPQKAAGGTARGEFTSLFDGKTLQGWHTNEKTTHGKGGRWRVEDGMITGQQDPPGSGNGGLLMTDQKYGDFELLVDMAPDWGIDSGVFLRTNDRGKCVQVYVDYRENGNVGSISTETPKGQKRMFIRPYTIFPEKDAQGNLTGFTTKPDQRDVAWNPDYLEYSASPQEWKAAWNVGAWNTLRIRCVGKYPRITTWINYTKIIEFDGATCPHPRYDRERMFQMLGREGAIALQVHGGTRSWRKGAKCKWDNIRVKPL